MNLKILLGAVSVIGAVAGFAGSMVVTKNKYKDLQRRVTEIEEEKRNKKEMEEMTRYCNYHHTPSGDDYLMSPMSRHEDSLYA